MRGVYYSACSLCYITISVIKQKYLLMRDCLLLRRLLLPESTVFGTRPDSEICVIHVVILNDWIINSISNQNIKYAGTFILYQTVS